MEQEKEDKEDKEEEDKEDKEDKEEKEEAVGPRGLLAGVHALIVDMNRLH